MKPVRRIPSWLAAWASIAFFALGLSAFAASTTARPEAATAVSPAGHPAEAASGVPRFNPRAFTAPPETSLAPRALSTPFYSVTGKWTDAYGYAWSVSEAQSHAISGLAVVGCTRPWIITGTNNGSSFVLLATNPVSDGCAQWFQYTMTYTSATTASGSWINSAGYSGTVTMTATETCASVINNAVSGPMLSGGGLLSGSTNITATFAPTLNGSPYGLKKAATLCGFTNFDWVQTITVLPDPSPFFSRATGKRLTSASTPFNDPPAGGGYTYEGAADYSYPFYYDAASGELVSHETADTLSFGDAPSDPCLSGPLGLPGYAWLSSSSVRAICLGTTSPRGSQISFVTHLAGVQPGGTAVDLGIGFSWTSSFNGTFGGLAQTKSDASAPPDAGSGTGGITVTSVNTTTTYEYIGSPVLAPTLLTGDQVAVHSSGLAYSHATQTFVGTVTLTNRSSSPVAGPIQLVLSGLDPSVAVQGAPYSFGGFPYVTLVSAGTVAPGTSVSIALQFKNPSNRAISFTPLAYSGSFH